MLKSFAFALSWRIAALVALTGAAFFALFKMGWSAAAAFFALCSALAAGSIWHVVNDTNRRLARFFESVRYADFAVRFARSSEKGASFEAISREFNEVLETFRRTRAEKEANLIFLNALVQQLSTGILAFDAAQNLLLSNAAAFQFLGLYRLQNLDELPPEHAPLRAFVAGLSKKNKLLYSPKPGRQIAVLGSSLSLQGRSVRLLTLADIHPELQQKELNAWRDLTRVLRHEIMNSVTPIVSLVETAQEILRKDIKAVAPPAAAPALADLDEALEVAAARASGLVRFVDAYRAFSVLPVPKPTDFSALELLERAAQLASKDLRAAQIELNVAVSPPDLRLRADQSLIEQVLLNLLKNAREALAASPADRLKRIELTAALAASGRPFIAADDSGPGIEPTIADEIFIPFFTTKPDGTGVGLSLSRQIAQLHGGSLETEKSPLGGARLVFYF